MEATEAAELIRAAASNAGRKGLLDEKTTVSIFQTCEGHAYAMKLLASSIESKVGLANVLSTLFQDERLLDALFRQSVSDVGEEAEFIFLLASRFPQGVSEAALRTAAAAEEIHLGPALQMLRQRSLVEVDDTTRLYTMPALAREFARRLAVGHVHGIAVEEAEKYLKHWNGLVSDQVAEAAVAMEASVLAGERTVRGRATTDTLRVLTEYSDDAWPSLARALRATGAPMSEIDAVYKRAVESDPTASYLFDEWGDAVSDPDRRLQLKVQAVIASPSNFKLASNVAKFLNSFRSLHKDRYSRPKRTGLMEPVADVLHRQLHRLDANDCSRLAWLYLNLGNEVGAREVVRRGHHVDEDNYNISKLVERLDMHRELAA
jgi:hypothetical protein